MSLVSITRVLTAALLATTCSVARGEGLDFDREVAPLLARRCLGCHNASAHKGGLDLSSSETARRGGDSGAAYIAAKVEESLLWKRVAEDEMPPKKGLPAAEKEVLRRWISAGAKWGTDPVDVFRCTTETRAGYDWWSLQPVVRPRPPAVSDSQSQRVRHPIDRFVLAKLE